MTDKLDKDIERIKRFHEREFKSKNPKSLEKVKGQEDKEWNKANNEQKEKINETTKAKNLKTLHSQVRSDETVSVPITKAMAIYSPKSIEKKSEKVIEKLEKTTSPKVEKLKELVKTALPNNEELGNEIVKNRQSYEASKVFGKEGIPQKANNYIQEKGIKNDAEVIGAAVGTLRGKENPKYKQSTIKLDMKDIATLPSSPKAGAGKLQSNQKYK